jgi:DNA-binding response OmpR family regulator
MVEAIEERRNLMSELALIIEDDEDLSEIFSQALRAAGFETEVILDGLVAQQRIPLITPQIVILDLYLPHVSGQVLFQQMRGDVRLEKTQIIVTTSDAVLGEDMRPLADFVLIKPTTFTQLRDMALRLHRQ